MSWIPIDSPAEWAWFGFTCLVALVWLRRHGDIARGQRDKVLTAADADSGLNRGAAGNGALPPLTMIVAAKDEEANIGRCVEGLRAQEYPGLELIFVNDRSSDRTGRILDEAARQDPRVAAVHVRQLRDGWFGKNNAMREGAERAGGRWLCFSDADCVYDSPKLLTAAMRYALAERIDFLSVLPKLEAHTLWERVVQPVAGAVMVFWFPPQKVNSPASPRAYANGAFMLMSRETYDAIGGHEPVRTQVNEDMHMARLTKRAGRRLRVVRSSGLYRVRMYTGFREIWRGWSRIFFGCFGTLPRLLISVAFLSLFSLSPYVTLLAAPLTGMAWLAFALAGLAAIVAQQSVLWRFWALSEIRPAWALTYPIGAAICLGMTFSAIGRLGGVRTTTWRGTTYRGHAIAGDSKATADVGLAVPAAKGPPAV